MALKHPGGPGRCHCWSRACSSRQVDLRRSAAAARSLCVATCRGTFSMGKWGPATFCNGRRWIKEAAEDVQFTVRNGYFVTILQGDQPVEPWKRTPFNPSEASPFTSCSHGPRHSS